MSEARLVWLRRPPVLVCAEGRHVPRSVPMDAVDERWRALCAANPRYFDGTMLHVLGVSRNGHGGVQIVVQECAYRFYAVQQPFEDLEPLMCGVRPLGVKAIATDGPRVLVGRRSRSVAYYPGLWEFVPGGGLEPGVEPAAQVAKEFEEEAGVLSVGRPIAVALLFDPVARTWEIVHSVQLDASAAAVAGWEYDEFAWVEPGALPEPLAPVAAQMAGIARRLTRGG